MHFLLINLYSFLPKIEEIKNIAKKSKATVIDISETKLDGIIFDAEIYIEVYSIVRCDRDMTSVSALKIFFLKMLKPSLWIFSFENQALICSYSWRTSYNFFTIICRNFKFSKHIKKWDIRNWWHECKYFAKWRKFVRLKRKHF